MSSSGANNAGGGGGGGGDSSGSKQQEYTEQQKADRADVTKALTDQTNMDTMDRWGKSSSEDRRRRKQKKEKDKKCTTSPSVVELAIAKIYWLCQRYPLQQRRVSAFILGRETSKRGRAIATLFFLRWGSARLLEPCSKLLTVILWI